MKKKYENQLVMDNNKNGKKDFPTLKSDKDAIKSSSSLVADDALWVNAGADDV